MERIAFEDMSGAMLYAGYVGENAVKSVSVDCSAVLARYAGATVTMLLRPPYSTDVFPAACTVTNGVATHVFTDDELRVSGVGQLSVMITTTAGQVKKSAAAMLTVTDTLSQNKDAPPEVINWILSISSRLIPIDGVQFEGLSAAVQASLNKADTALQEHQSLAAYRTAAEQDAIDGGFVTKETGKGLSTNDYTAAEKTKLAGIETGADVTDAENVAAAGAYFKPSSGIPQSDLSSAVQASLNKADTALQEHQSLAAYRTAAEQDAIDGEFVTKETGKGLSTNDYTAAEKTKLAGIETGADVTDAENVAAAGAYFKPSSGIPQSDLSSAVQASLNKVDNVESWTFTLDDGTIVTKKVVVSE